VIAKSELISVSVKIKLARVGPGRFTEEEICDWGIAIREWRNIFDLEKPNRSDISVKGCNQVTQSLRRRF
jgi:hypothetical protein